jgi:hypothetical protein
MFNPDQFLDMTVTDSNDTKTIPVPAGEYIAIVEEVKCRQWQSKKDPSMSGLTLDIQWSLDDAGVKETLGRDKVTVKQGIMLDITDSGGLDMGKGRNVGLGRLRDALGLNVPGQPFSFSMLSGRVAKVKVEHRIDGDNLYAEVKGVAKM